MSLLQQPLLFAPATAPDAVGLGIILTIGAIALFALIVLVIALSVSRAEKTDSADSPCSRDGRSSNPGHQPGCAEVAV